MKVTAAAPANIALVKYWGQKDVLLNLPNNSSISFNLSNVTTTTTVNFLEALTEDRVFFNQVLATDVFSNKVIEHLNIVRSLAGKQCFAQVDTHNNFPTGAGIASSASGFAALSLAATKAIGLNLTPKEVSILARKGSGSACRSIPDGFVKWHKGRNDATSYASSLYPASYWLIHDIIVVVSESEKGVSSLSGHSLAATSLLYRSHVRNISNRLASIELALQRKDFTLLGETTESEALNLHAVMMTSNPSLMYWTAETIKVIEQVKHLRSKGVECYFTLDAGANVHVLSLAAEVEKIRTFFNNLAYVRQVIDAQPADGARLIE